MTSRYTLPAPAPEPEPALPARLRAYFLGGWPGRILLAALVVWGLAELGVPVPEPAAILATAALWCFGLLWGFRLVRWLVRRFMWRIRTKLLVSYLFIAVVPVVLLVMFFLLAGALMGGLVAGHMVSGEVQRAADSLDALATAAMARLPLDDPHVAAALEARLAPARAIHPKLSYTLVRAGRSLAASGDAPRGLPAWWTERADFHGFVVDGERYVLRAVSVRGDAFLVLEAPVDKDLFKAFEERTGIHLLTVGGRVERRGEGEIQISVNERSARRIDPSGRGEDIAGLPFFALAERTDWETGGQEAEPITFYFEPRDFIKRLSPGALNTGEILVRVLGIVGVVFLVMYGVALLVGLLVARTITRSVHALSVGTEKLRQGDFAHAIEVRSRDQLGDLAESFNVMARGIQSLLQEQAEKERLEEELRIARQIQMSLLPQGAVDLPGLRVAALCLPAAEVGGDYYDLLPLSPTRMGVLVADVSGKGTSAALYMAELKGLVLSLSRIYDSPAQLLREANRILAANMDSRSFVTMTYAVVDTEARRMRYARAGHNPLIHLDGRTGLTRVLTPAGLGLGIDGGDRFDQILEEDDLPLVSGDTFLFFTDGLSEAMNGASELFGEHRLREVLERAEDLGSDALRDRILEEIQAFVGEAAQHDDMTLVILKVQ
jgi:sigma-B regulation protein RsbU (phosphoserine phosphatase)